MSNGVVRWRAIHHLTRRHLPLHDFGGDEERRIRKALVVEFGVQRSQPRVLYFSGQRRLILEHGDAIDVALEVLGLDRFEQFTERVNRNHRRELATGRDVLPCGVHICAVRRFGCGKEVDRSRTVRGRNLRNARDAYTLGAA